MARKLCSRRQTRYPTTAGTSCRWCRPSGPADGRAVRGRLGSSAPVDGPPVRRWFLLAPPIPCFCCSPGTVLRGSARSSGVTPPRSPSFWPYSTPAQFSSDLVSVGQQPQAWVLAQEGPYFSGWFAHGWRCLSDDAVTTWGRAPSRKEEDFSVPEVLKDGCCDSLGCAAATDDAVATMGLRGAGKRGPGEDPAQKKGPGGP